MKQLALSLIMLGIPFWLPEALPGALARAELIEAPAAAPNSPQMVWVSSESPEGGTKGWLGVSIDEVPEALAAQLEIPEGGILIVNVTKDGPADKAGIQVHDVVLSVDGQSIDEDAPRLAELIGAHKPGDKVPLVLFRQGQRKTVTVDIGARPGQDGIVWKFDTEPRARIEERVRTRGKIMGKGPGGEWFVKDLGDLDKLKDLGDKIKVLVPHGGNRSTQVFVDGNRKMVKTVVEDDGSSITIKQEDEGNIVVQRTDQDGKETSAAYENEDQLKAADPDAYELYAGPGKGAFLHLDIDALGKHGEVTVEMGEWQEKLEEGLREAQEAMDRARTEWEEKAHELAERFHGVVPPSDGRSEPNVKMLRNKHFPGLFGAGAMGKPKQSFSVNTDGSIEVRIRKGDSEVVRTFAGEADLSKRDPKLYEKYQSVMSSADE